MADRVPDQSLIEGDAGSGAEHIRAARASDGCCAFIYIPTGNSVLVNPGALSPAVIKAWW